MVSIDLQIVGNAIDCDPYHTNPWRTPAHPGGYRQAKTGDNVPAAIWLKRVSGVTVHTNTVRNCYTVIDGNGGDLSAHRQIANQVACQPVSATFSTANKGVAEPGLASPERTHVIVNSDPTSGDYGTVLNQPLDCSDQQPKSCTYVEGHVVHARPLLRQNNTLVTGWLRLTTGDRHVGGTDWQELIA